MKLKEIFVVTRAWSLTITFISVTAGSLVASQEGKFSFWLYLLCLIGACLFHAGANTLNDYFDLKNKIDTPESPTALYRPHPIFTNIMTPKKLFIFSCLLLASASFIGIFLQFFLKVRLFAPMILLGLILAIFYTLTPKGLKYISLGEPAVFLAFGPLMVEGAYAVQAKSLSLKAFYVSIPLGLLVALILLANNLRDLDFDAKSGIKTMAVLMGRARTMRFFTLLAISPLVFVIIYILLGIISWPAIIVFLSLPLIIKLTKEFSKEVPVYADAKTSQVSLVFGLLFTGVLFLEKFIA